MSALLAAGCGKPAVDSPPPAPAKGQETQAAPSKQIDPPATLIGPIEGRIAFENVGSRMIHVASADGADEKKLMLGSAPAWSPDGKQIAFVQFFNDTNRFETVVMDADGQNVKRLTKSPVDDSIAPAWSPDGKQLVLQAGALNTPHLAVMNADGGNKQDLTNPGGKERSPSWSPDGKRIAFISPNQAKYQGLYVMNADGSSRRSLSEDKTHCHDPAWSPDGKHIAFAANQKHRWTLRVLNPDTGNYFTLIESPKQIDDPCWSPTGDWLAFSLSKDGQRDIYIIDVTGSGLRQVTNHAKADRHPSWTR